MDIENISSVFGKDAKNLISLTKEPNIDGAFAALETFYHAFNNRSIELFKKIWVENSLCQLNNPLGGILRGGGQIGSLYELIFNGPAKVWVEFHDIILYRSPGAAIFAGRERGEYEKNGIALPLAIRTTRVFLYDEKAGRWGQAHHHGSIDDAQLLLRYQEAVKG